MAKVTTQQLLDAAVDAIEHVAQANWREREVAAIEYVRRVANGEMDKTIEQIQEENEKE